jgi:hypothetical protein
MTLGKRKRAYARKWEYMHVSRQVQSYFLRALNYCRPGEGRGPIAHRATWIPASAGMTANTNAALRAFEVSTRRGLAPNQSAQCFARSTALFHPALSEPA